MRFYFIYIAAIYLSISAKGQENIKPIVKYDLPPILSENSGVIFWDNLLWLHNDGGNDPAIYGFDTLTSSITRRITIKNGYNIDWEDIAQDESYIYIGDIGNNRNGSRPKLTIYKILKADIKNSKGNISLNAETINFNYEDQNLYKETGISNDTNFDCEAMIAINNKIFLFTKQWKTNKTNLYELDNVTNNQIARLKDSLWVEGMITGAGVCSDKNIIALSGYTKTGLRFIYLLSKFKGTNFFKGNIVKYNLSGFAQTESIAFISERYICIGSEKLMGGKPRIEMIDITKYLY